MAQADKTKPVAAVLTEEQRKFAMERFAVIRPHLEEDVPLAQAAQHAGVALRTAERWLSLYRKKGLNGLARPSAAMRMHAACLLT